jgi:hypothetical protein
MSAIWIHIDEARRGTLPARCARTGQRCMTRYATAASDLPAPVEWLTWTDVWPRRQVQGQPGPEAIVLPLLPSRQRLATALRRTRDVTAATLLPALLAWAFVDGMGGRLLGWLLLALVVGHVLAAVVGLLATVGVRVDYTGEWVHLDRVHRSFVEAAEAMTTRPVELPRLTAPPPAASTSSTPEGG